MVFTTVCQTALSQQCKPHETCISSPSLQFQLHRKLYVYEQWQDGDAPSHTRTFDQFLLHFSSWLRRESHKNWLLAVLPRSDMHQRQQSQLQRRQIVRLDRVHSVDLHEYAADKVAVNTELTRTNTSHWQWHFTCTDTSHWWSCKLVMTSTDEEKDKP